MIKLAAVDALWPCCAVFSLFLPLGCGDEQAKDEPGTLQPTTDLGAFDAGRASDSQDTAQADDTSRAADTAQADDAAQLDDAADALPTDISGSLDSFDSAPDSASPDGDDADAADLADASTDANAGPPDAAPIDAGPPVCDPPLAIAPQAMQTLPFDLHTFKSSGGTGAHRFALVKNGSGAILNQFSGAYLSGEKPGTVDVIELTDTGCIGTATAKVTVVGAMQLAPTAAVIAPGTSLQLQVTGGSGDVKFGLKLNASGATIDTKTGAYSAGVKLGTDVITASDTATGQSATASFVVQKGAVLAARPTRVIVPVGGRFVPQITGGSGHFSVSVGAPFVVEKDSVTATKAGKSTVTIVDTFTKQKTTIEAEAAAALDPLMPPTGDGFGHALAIGPGDLNGDGYADALLAVPEADVLAYNSGAVMVYHGGPKGLAATAKQVLSGDEIEGRYGWAMAAADIDGDGRPDLIAGEPLADAGMSNNGAVHIHRGLPDGTFEPQPTRKLTGPIANDQFGHSLAACDFNGDKRTDLAVAALYGDKRDGTPIVTDTGVLHVFLGHEDGLLAKADQLRYGHDINGKGALVPKQSLRVGWWTAAGDFDGDGLCDLATSSLYYVGNGANDGAVFIYKGVGESKDGLGGITQLPVRMWTGIDSKDQGGQFGRSIAVGDFDGDGKAELAVGYPYLDAYTPKKQVNAGALLFYELSDISAKPLSSALPYTAAARQIFGDNAYDSFGRALAAGDVDGDGTPELLSANISDEVAGKPGGTGVLAVYKGTGGQLPAPTPALAIPGVASGDWFGIAAAALGDVDKDGNADLLVYASHEDTDGRNHGMPYAVSVAAPYSLKPLKYSTKAAGSRFGYAVAIVADVTGDGQEDLLVGAPYAEGADLVAGKWVYADTSSGSAYLYPGSASGFATKATSLHRFAGHGGSDLLGWDVSGAGDFDGDGAADFAVVARNEDRPSSFNSAFEKGTKCGTAENDIGAIYVYAGGKAAGNTPSWIAYGVKRSSYVEAVDGGGDINGDGRGDLVMGSLYWDAPGRGNAGGWGVVWGRKRAAAGLRVVCAPDESFIGPKANDYVGRSVAVLGDLDGDKCAEFAVGADAEDLGLTNQGTVRVIFGWGATCKSKTPREVVLVSGSNNGRAGYSMDSHADVDGDGLNDLVVGGFNHVVGGQAVGAAWVVTGKYIASLVPKAIKDGAPPAATYPLVEPGSNANLNVVGQDPGGQFGWSVALVPGLESDGRAGVIVGAPRGGVGGTALAGGATVYRFLAGAKPGLTAASWAAVIGESHRPAGLLGWSVAAGKLGAKPVIAVGSHYGTAYGGGSIDNGTVYVGLLK